MVVFPCSTSGNYFLENKSILVCLELRICGQSYHVVLFDKNNSTSLAVK